VLSLEGSSGTSKKPSFYTTSGGEVRTTFGVEAEEMNSMTMKITYDGFALRPEIHRVRLLPFIVFAISRTIRGGAKGERRCPTA
jgi:hypothetical protein